MGLRPHFHLSYKTIMPNLPFVPGTYSFTGIANAAKGKTDVFGRDQSIGTAAASSLGIKLGAYPRNTLMRNEKFDFDTDMRELKAQASAANRQAAQGGITREELRKQLAAIREKELARAKELREKMNPPKK